MNASLEEGHALQRLYAALEEGTALDLCNGCDGCGDRCVDGVELTLSEFLAILEYLRTLSPEEVQAVLSQPKRRRWEGVAWVEICLFRDEVQGRCLVYPVRPFICRLFGHVEWMPCPIGALPSPPPESKHWLWEYVLWPRRTLREWLALLPEAEWLRRWVEEATFPFTGSSSTPKSPPRGRGSRRATRRSGRGRKSLRAPKSAGCSRPVHTRGSR